MSRSSDEWASKFAARLEKKNQATADANALFMQQQAMIRSYAPDLWDSLRSAINERAGSVNALAKSEYFRPSPAVQGYTDHSLTSRVGRLLLVFRPEVPILKYTFTRAATHGSDEPEPVEGETRFQVADGNVWFVRSEGTRMSAAQAAEYFLEMHS